MRKEKRMASIKENRKKGKIISFKFRVFIGRDEHGRQQFRTKTWKPDKEYTEKRLWRLAEAEAALWEREIACGDAFEEEPIEDVVEEIKPPQIAFDAFVNGEWLPSLQNEDCRATTYEFRTYLLQIILPYFGDVPISDINSQKVDDYLEYLKRERKNAQGKPLSPQTRKHHYSTLNLIFKYAIR